MPDDLPVDVLTELGRVTWAAIKLEDYASAFAGLPHPAAPLDDRRRISQKIKDAEKALGGRTPSATREEALAWLARVRRAAERRNAVLHAVPVVWIGGERDGEQGLGEMPRKGSPYVEWPLTVESLSGSGWSWMKRRADGGI